MSKLVWDKEGERRYETGVDHGVLFLRDAVTGEYETGIVWNGLTAVTESPTGAEATPQYADNMKYLNLMSNEEFGATIEAFTYPDEFEALDGSLALAAGVYAGQQARGSFGFSYRTKIGNDLVGQDAGYKIHLVYGCMASPSEKARNTVNDSPEAVTFSWELTTTPVEVGTVGAVVFRPTAHISISSLEVEPADLTALETILYGTDAGEGGTPAAVVARMPLPAEIITLFAA
jgi:hypothetical protein